MPPSQADRSFLTQVYKDLADEPLQPDNPFFEPVYELLGRDDPVQQIFTLIGAATRPAFGTYVKAVVPMLRGIGTASATARLVVWRNRPQTGSGYRRCFPSPTTC
jgi:hypothetical protein